MKKFIIACVAVAAFAAPALAGQPDGTFVFKDNTDYTKIDNLVGQKSAQIIQNGQFVSDQAKSDPGARAAVVQQCLSGGPC
jgi:Ni/Co efflux regulator RcnB